MVNGGCLTVGATCDASAIPGGTTEMTFQGNLPGPSGGGTATVSGTLDCSSSGVWTFNNNPITTINCALDVNTCASCLPNSISLPTGNGMDSLTAILGTPTLSAGCLTVSATCDASAIFNGFTILMFQGGVVGPSPTGGSIITADLSCMNGAWGWTDDNSVTTAVSEVTCSLGTRDPGCGSCTPLLIAFTPPAIFRNLGVGPDGCAVITVVCPRVPLLTVVMRFNTVVTGPSASNSEVTATLTCQNNAWTYTGGSMPITVAAVSCSPL
ncbi:hypothetical protein FO519_005352 [Halicephalobus sp. NKZ332]|nr:hypothetical protein FO519_005352 [Halicephalobus sp. NKZ332]